MTMPCRPTTPTTRRRTLAGVAAVALLAAGCGGDGDDEATGGSAGTTGTTGVPVTTTVQLVTHDSFNVSEDVLAAFTAETGIEVEILRGGDAVGMVNRAILTAGSPEADVLFGIDQSLLEAAREAELFDPHEAADLDRVDPEVVVDPDYRVTPIDRGDVCVNYDRQWFAEADVAVPETLEDLADPAYDGLLVVQNPATSSPGLAFLAGTVEVFGEGGYLDYWDGLVANDVAVEDGWEQAYYGRFSGGSGEGDRPLVVSYATSPPVEVVFSEAYEATGELPDEAPTGVLADTCIAQVEYAGVLRGTDEPEAAGALVDFLLSEAFQADVALQMYVEPVREGIELPEVFTRFSGEPESVIEIDPVEIGGQRDAWVTSWTEAVLG
jgi:thiamine transport system substrate-binding protein